MSAPCVGRDASFYQVGTLTFMASDDYETWAKKTATFLTYHRPTQMQPSEETGDMPEPQDDVKGRRETRTPLALVAWDQATKKGPRRPEVRIK